MPHVITISDENFARMQSLAIPLVDTPESIIARALTALEGVAPSETGDARILSLNPAAPPSLSHTTPTRISLNGTLFARSATNWNYLMIALIEQAARRGLGPEEIMAMLTINSVVGRKVDSGYKYVDAAGISVQGQDANSAWRQAYELARQLRLGLEVEFVWQDNPKAAMPGHTGRFSVGSGG